MTEESKITKQTLVFVFQEHLRSNISKSIDIKMIDGALELYFDGKYIYNIPFFRAFHDSIFYSEMTFADFMALSLGSVIRKLNKVGILRMTLKLTKR